jgi:Spy/CpxP family protein refolding chaperone
MIINTLLKMKTTLLYITIFLLSLASLAQPNRDRIRAIKVAHITDRLDLTEKEAQQFWPIYNAYDENISTIRSEEMRVVHREIRQSSGSLSDEEANNLLERFMSAENKIHAERTQLVEKLRKVISPRKIILLKVAEEDFNRRILDEMKRRRQRLNKNRPKKP